MTDGAGSHGDAGLAETLASRTEALCAVPSPIGEEKALCDELESWARSRFPRVRRVLNSLVVHVDPEAPAAGAAAAAARPLVALCGHLDTVPVHPDDRGPPRREGGRIVAPGSSDMKAGLAVAMELALRLPRAERFADLALVLYSREEGPYEENELGPLLDVSPELRRAGLAVCLEPTDGKLQLGCVGSLHATVTFTGRAAHSARPWQGDNAVHRAGALLAHLAARAPRDVTSGGLPFREVISATRIEGGRARNVVPDRCTMNLNFRFAPDKPVDVAVRELEDLALEFGGTAAVTDRAPSCPAFVEDPLVGRLRERARLEVEPKQAWTDVARLAAAGIPAVNLGPGATTQAHQRGEWVEVAALPRSFEALRAFLAP